MKLMIIESPGKVKKLKAILGGGWDVAPSVGHINDLPLNEVGVYPPNFEPQYNLSERGKEVVAKLKEKIRTADEVFLATDPDREGEAISWHLANELGLKNAKRVTFNEITEKAVFQALQNPRNIAQSLVAAQEARRVLDRLAGYIVSPEISNLSGSRLSAGRVQSPAVRLVVEREREIRSFKSTTHFGARMIFSYEKMNTSWSAEWQTKSQFANDDAPYVLDRRLAEAVAESTNLKVISFVESQANRNPPPPFTTSTLQQAANVTLGADPKATMAAAQRLYEQGHITYHRTDNPNIADEAFAEIRDVAQATGLEMNQAIRKFKAPEGAQAGHPAITPTHWEVLNAGEDDIQQALYTLIRNRAIACQLAAATYAVRTVVISGEAGPHAVTFEGQGRTLVNPGWLALTKTDTTEDEDESAVSTNPIPFLNVGDALFGTGELLEKKTKAPPRYTTATLIRKLEKEGIGRPSTYAAIIDNIVGRGYVNPFDKKNSLESTPTGETVVDLLVDRFGFADVPFTREMEGELDRIEHGQADYVTVIRTFYDYLMRDVANLRATAAPKYPCPDCGRALVHRQKAGKDGYNFWGCSGFKDGCKTSLTDNNGVPGEKKGQGPALSEHKCPGCGKPLIHRVKPGKGGYNFWGCSGFKDGCTKKFNDRNGTPAL